MGKSSFLKTKDLALTAIFTAIIVVCSWITVPGTVPFTLQTFGVFLTTAVLGGKRGTVSVLVYILLGAIGLPVFSNFMGGMGVILGSTGGYIAGFLFTALTMWLFEKIFGKKTIVLAISMLIGLIVCYAIGTAWFMVVYTEKSGAVGLWTTLSWCVFPFIIPDILKLGLAVTLTKKLKSACKID